MVLCNAAGHAIHVDDEAAILIGRDPTAGATERLRAWQRLESLLLDETGAPLDPERFPVRLAVTSGQPIHDVIVVLPAFDGKPARRLQITAEPLRTAANVPPSGIVVVLIEVSADSSSAPHSANSAALPPWRWASTASRPCRTRSATARPSSSNGRWPVVCSATCATTTS